MADADQIALGRAMDLLDEARELCKELDGLSVNFEGNNKERMQESARRSRALLYAAHMADLARAEILNSYHRFKGEEPPAIEL